MAAGPAPPGEPLAARQSIFNRLVRGAIAFASVSLVVLFGIVVTQSWRSSERTLEAAVDTDIAGLVDIYASGGEGELRARLEDRAAVVGLEGRQARYLLARPGGAVLGGNVDGWPALSPALSEQGFVTLADGERVYAKATRLAPDLDLLVARTYAHDSAAVLHLALLFLAAAAMIIFALWLIGRRSARLLRARLDAISAAFRAAEEGRQPPLGPAQSVDEIGELASLSTRAIARAATLARTHRHMSDHIAHEIRTPLAHLESGLVDARRKLSPGAADDLLERSRQDIRSVVAMLDSLLDIAASEARVGDRTGLQEVDLSALATDLADLYAGSAEEEGITLRTRIDPGVRLMGERMQLTRLLSNLLDNALKYVPGGGEVILSVAPGPVIEVRDDGPGIAPELRALVFDRFRAGAPIAGKTSHGLGLALARAIALRHGLSIALADAPVGAHFIIRPSAMDLGEGGEQ